MSAYGYDSPRRRAARRRKTTAVDWTWVANRAIRLVAIHCFIAGVALFGLALREATAAPQELARPAEPHDTYRMTVVTPSPRPAAPHRH